MQTPLQGKFLGLLLLVAFIASAKVSAQSITVEEVNAVNTGTSVDVDWSMTDGAVLEGVSFAIAYDNAVFTPDLTSCLSVEDADQAQCVIDVVGGQNVVKIGLLNFSEGDPLGAASGTIGFGYASGATLGEYALTVTEDTANTLPVGTSITLNSGKITMQAAPAPDISVDPSSGTFSAPLGSTDDVTFTVENSGNADGLLVTSVATTGDNFATVSTTNCPGLSPGLEQGGTCSVTVRFTPDALGAETGSLSIVSNAGTVDITLNGTGAQGPVGAIEITPSGPFDFPDLLAGVEEDTQVFVATNTGAAGSVVTISSAELSLIFGSPLSIVASTCTNGTQLAKDESCSVTVKDAPVSPGDAERTLTVSGTDINGVPVLSDSVTITGKGIEEARPTSDPVSGTKQTESLTGTDTEHTFSVVFGNTGNISYDYDCDLNDTTGVFSISNNENVTVAADGSTQTMAVACDTSSSVSGTYAASASCTVNGQAATYQFECVMVRPLLGVEDTSHNFMAEVATESEPYSFELCNVGNADGLTFTLPFEITSDAGDSDNFSVDSNDCSATEGLAQEACCTVGVTFSPDEIRDDYSASMAVVSSHGSQDITLTGEGTEGPVGEIDIIPAGPFDFGDLLVRIEEDTKTFEVTNMGAPGSVVTVSGAALSALVGSPLSIVSDTNTCVSGTELEYTESCFVTVKYAPTSPGVATRTLTVSGTDVNGTELSDSVEITGTGIERAIPTSNPADGTSESEVVGPEGSNDFTVIWGNEGNIAYDVSCALTSGYNEEVWSVTGASVTVEPGEPKTVTTTCALPDTETYTETLTCSIGQVTSTFSYECVGLPPLPVPADNKWALALLALMMLMAASFGFRVIARQ